MHIFVFQAKEIQEELALDMKLLEQMLQETSNETMQQLQKKVRIIPSLQKLY